ncbi:serine/threonine protein kinase [Oscillatoriales cyanobacterium USR001]|nr:serine/threonine protein kinase [Oscillatoriales cyanobacterium USR001]
MLKLKEYQVFHPIYEGFKTVIYQAERSSDNTPVIIKTLRSEYPTIEEISRLRHEYNILQSLKIEGIIKPIELTNYQNSLVLVLEYFESQSLKKFVNAEKLDLKQFLNIAIQIAIILDQIHQNQVIHKDIKPQNIIINPKTRQIKIIDFSIATSLEKETQSPMNPNCIEGTLAYMSPEQTGRMNRTLDYRTDFYSLGVTFYEMLTGQLPFDSVDAMELIHCHIAKNPIPLHQLNPELPLTVANIVTKLLAKNAEDRYQSALGLKADLEECLTQLQTTGTIAEFMPGRVDKTGQFLIPQKLYGREAEVETLLQAFERVSLGQSEMMLVSGYSGIGKTCVIQEIHKPIVRQRGYFISGKFDQFKRDIPYAAITQAFQELMRQLLTQNSDEIAVWQEKLLVALGENGQIIIDVIPEVELIIGKQPEVSQFGPTESQNRFNRIFQQFIYVFAQPSHPLVLFLDDLQWADLASLNLIEQLMTDSDSHYLLMIGAYRDNEVSPVHPTIQTLEKIEKAGSAINNIVLQPLDISHVSQLVGDTLSEVAISGNRIFKLAELLYNKTQGNPFFLTQLFKTLASENLLTFNFELNQWQWSIEKIQSLGITDFNIVELVARNIRKLPDNTQRVLKLAACMGNRFNLDALAIVNEKSSTDTTEYLWSALQAGLILPLSNDYKIALLFQPEDKSELLFDKSRVGYKFLHDRVQQAAYSLIPESDKKTTHLKIGQLLWKNTPSENIEENIFDIVNQVNIGQEFISSSQEKEKLAALNLIAGRKAKSATAYEVASRCLNVALDLLPESGWQSHYELTRDIYIETLEAEYLNINFQQAQNLSEIILSKSKSLLEKVQVNELKIPFYLQQNQPNLSLELSLQTLQLLGVFLPKKPQKINILLEFIYTKLIIAKQPIECLATLPLMTDPYKLAAIRILMNAVPAAFMSNPSLFPLIVFKIVSLSIKYGNSPLSAYGYASYALLMCGPLGDIDSGYKFGQLALKLLEIEKVKIKAKILFLINIFVKSWKEPVKDSLPGLIEGFQSGISTGDIEYACYIASGYCQYVLWTGEHLQNVSTTQDKYIFYLQKNKQEVNLEVSQIWNQFVCNLMGNNEIPYCLKGLSFDETTRLSILISTNNKTLLAGVYLSKFILLYLFKDYLGSVKVAKLAEDCQESISGQLNIAQYNFYYSLALLAHYPTTTKTEQKEYLKKVATHQKQMKIWATHAPMNFQHKYELVEAEKARVLGQNETAITYYDRAIKGAKEQGFIQEEALANERAAEFYLACDREKVAKAYMTEAYYCYIRWGAVAKVRDLEETYSYLISRTLPPEFSDLDPTMTTTANRRTTSTSSHSTALDLTTIMKAAQALSGEIVFSELLRKLMTILIENAGATRCSLLTPKTISANQNENDWVISATGIIEGNKLNILNNHQQPETENTTISLPENAVPATIINYVVRTQETVVLNDASHEGIFTKDPYIQQHQSKSILCMPLLNQGQFTGIIYLENNLTTLAFTADRLAVLQILSGQAAVAITNAKLYSEVSQLNQNLEKSNQDLEQANQQLAEYSETLEQKVEERTAELKLAQKQIVATEKLASLGALTAGVAHEIRNPLNFVTSLATLSQDLTSEIAEEVERQAEKLDSESLELINENLTYLKRNVSEINEQGQRANSIIQSMLMHSRSDSSSRQRTDINALVAQALQLAYHSIRAKDPGFNLIIETDYDQSITELEVAFSDLSRALINIIDNACYASHAKLFQVGGDFQPTIVITTKNLDTTAEIHIRDNGMGISKENQEKIFLPFFTTKPPGQGTGLGLSITHEIIVGQHRGNLEVKTELGNYTEFIITLPKI